MSPILDIAYVRYQVTDLDRLAPFLQDFGLQAVARTGHALYSRSAGPAHHVHIAELGPVNATLGFGLLARSAADLAELARRVQRPVETTRNPVVASACASPTLRASWWTLSTARCNTRPCPCASRSLPTRPPGGAGWASPSAWHRPPAR